jgi:hypothetical protein
MAGVLHCRYLARKQEKRLRMHSESAIKAGGFRALLLDIVSMAHSIVATTGS